MVIFQVKRLSFLLKLAHNKVKEMLYTYITKLVSSHNRDWPADLKIPLYKNND